MPEPILRAERLTKIYRSGAASLTVLSGVDLDFRSGESAAVVGESGVGKSTLLYLLAGLDDPTSGEICFNSRLLSRFSEAELSIYRNQQTGFIWQNYYLLPEFTALENVMMPLLIAGKSPSQARQASGEWLDQVGLASRSTHRAGELSGGEQQRVTIARALVTGPKLLFADEPTGNLDEDTGASVMELILSAPQAWDVTVVLATHNMAFAQRCHRVLRIAAAKITEEPRR